MNYYENTQETTYFNTGGNPGQTIYPNPNQPVYYNQNQPYYQDQTYYQEPNRMDFNMTGNGQVSETAAVSSVADETAVPETVESTLFIPGFLQTQLGKLMRVEFLVGNIVQDRVGILRQVGASYIIIQPIGESSMIMCDLFSIRFATIINRPVNGEDVIIT